MCVEDEHRSLLEEVMYQSKGHSSDVECLVSRRNKV